MSEQDRVLLRPSSGQMLARRVGKAGRWRTAPLLLLAASSSGTLASGCSSGSEPGVEPAVSALGTSEANCSNWSLFEQSFTGGGTVISPATYNPSGCAKGYRVNLVDYDGVKYNGGALVGYGGALPTTSAACTSMILRAYVWQRGSGDVMTFVNNRHKTGSWIVGRDGVGRCLPPVINLERDIGIVPNGARDYRVAITARTGADVTVPVVFTTDEKHVITPIDQVAKLQAYSTSLGPRSGANPDPTLQAIWNFRNTPSGQSLCRSFDFDRGLHAFTRAALVKAGGTASTVDARNTELTNLRTAMCTSGGTLANAHTALKNYLTNTLAIRTQIRNQLGTLVPGRDPLTLDGLAANMMSQVMHQGIGALVSKCDLDADPLIRFMTYGQLPAGVTDPTRVVLGACSNQSPAQAATSIGFGTTAAGSPNPVSAMAACMAELVAGASETRCSGTRATGAPDAGQKPTDICWNGVTYQKCSAPLQAEKTALDDKVRSDANEQASVRAKAVADSLPGPDAATENTVNHGEHIANIISITGGAIATIALAGPATAVAVVVGPIAFGVGLAAGLIAQTSAAEWYDSFTTPDAPAPPQTVDLSQWCASNPGERQWCDNFGGGTDYCPADPVMEAYGLPQLANLTWYETGGLNSPRQTTKQDLFNHCLCNMVDADYSAQNRGERPARAPASSCPPSEDRRKLDCVADPRMRPGDDGRPDPECLKLLSPGPLDANVWRGKGCELKLCPENQKPFSMPNGDCVCRIVNPASVTFPNCLLTPRASTGLCTDDASGACFCEPLFPLPPNGGDPFCRQKPTVLPGPLSSWLTADSDALHLDAFDATTDVLRVRTGGNTQFVSPTLFPNAFATRGSSIRQRAALFKAPAAGQNVDFKMYYTNRTKNRIRQFLGQCRMNSFAVGVLSNCDFPLPTIDGVNAGNLEDAFELELEVDTAQAYTTRVALGPISFAGTTFATPTNKLAPDCPIPNGSNGKDVIDIVNPLRGILNIGLDPRPVYPLPSGQLLDIPLARPVIRDIR